MSPRPFGESLMRPFNEKQKLGKMTMDFTSVIFNSEVNDDKTP